jgi:hypothetical protein
MGTDIHFFVERCSTDGWEAVGGEGEFYDGARNIPLFDALAGVRISSTWDYTGSKPIVEPRGLPDDLSPEVREYMGPSTMAECGPGDIPAYHSHGWYTLAELLNYDWPDVLSDFHDGTLRSIASLCYCTHLTPNDIRIVFAFDN